MTDEQERLKRRYEREKRSRKEAEALLESKSEELFHSNEALKKLAAELELKVLERTRELEIARDEAIASNRAKSEFLANMSHEIRTPMNGVLGMLHMLEKSKLTEQQREFIQTAQGSGQLLLGVINDILDFTKIEANKLELESIPFNLKKVLEQTLDTFIFPAKEKGLNINRNIDDKLPPALLGDPTRIRQILTNLLNNAIKFTDVGEISLSAEVGESGILIQVQDTGAGMTEEQQQKVLQPFAQADSSTTRIHGGTGLGLSICTRLISAMNSELQIQCQHGAGCTFGFLLNLPVADSATAGQELEDSNINRVSPDEDLWFGGHSLLVVDDNDINRRVATQILEAAGFSVDTCDNGGAALSAVQEKDYGAVLMDVQMPSIDGLTAATLIRALGEEYAQLPIIAMTAHALTGDREKSLAAGMDEHITKPIEPDILFKVLQRWLKPSHKTEQQDHKDKNTQSSPEQLPGIDIQDSMRRLRGNWSLLERIIISFGENQADAKEKLRFLLNSNDLKLAASLAHGIKGSAANIGATELSNYAGKIEKACKDNDASGATQNYRKFESAFNTVINSAKTLKDNIKEEEAKGQTDNHPKEIHQRLKKINDNLSNDLGVVQVLIYELKDLCMDKESRIQFTELETAFNQIDIDLMGRISQHWQGRLSRQE